jgi:hypothetical protein
MTALPVDVALAMAAAGIDVELDEDELIAVLHGAISDRSGYFDRPTIGDIGWTGELLSPERMTFEGQTEELALAWSLLYLMDARGEGGMLGFRH